MISYLKKKWSQQSGVALMMVLSSILIITTVAVEFAFNSHVSYELASAQRDRLKAYYLARSAVQMAKLEIKLERELKERYGPMLQKIPGNNISSDPLCKQIPLSTGILKGLASGALGQSPEGEEGKNVSAEKPEISSAAEEFLNFDGDFEVVCDTEERKINLNVFREILPPQALGGRPGLTPTQGGFADPINPLSGGVLSASDSQKELLFSLLSGKEFEDIFNGKPDDVKKVVNAIADWADRDDRINEAPGISGGSEDSLYSGPEYHYKNKNGKYTSVSELMLVAGVTDDLYKKLAPQVTVYGDNKVNLCQSSEDMVKAFVNRFIRLTPGVAPIADKDDTKWEAIFNAVQLVCKNPTPQAAQIAGAIAANIGISDTRGMVGQIGTVNRFYRLDATGVVNESRVKMSLVLDAGAPSPNLWKTLYFRAE